MDNDFQSKHDSGRTTICLGKVVNYREKRLSESVPELFLVINSEWGN